MEGVDLSNPEFQGFLTKRSRWIQTWRQRYFTLKGSKLYFSAGKGEPVHGIIDLSTCLTVKSAEEKVGKRHAFEVTTADETFYMFADSEKIKDDWIGAIGRAIVRFSKSFTSDDGYES